jgi:hypothetical protein
MAELNTPICKNSRRIVTIIVPHPSTLKLFVSSTEAHLACATMTIDSCAHSAQ